MVRPEEAPLKGHAVPRADLDSILSAALDAVAPDRLVRAWLRRQQTGLPDWSRHHVLAVGKAADGMLQAWTAGGPAGRALLVVPHPPRQRQSGIEVIVASHPVPDARSVAAAEAALSLAAATGPDQLLVVLLSGGASSLLALPAPPCTLADKIAVTARLLRDGVTIQDLNTVRRWLSAVKGGRLADAARGEVLTLAISDVVDAGEREAATIASGPTVPEPSTRADARAILARAWPDVGQWPHGVRALLAEPSGFVSSLQPGAALPRTYHIIGSRHTAVAAAAARARGLGYLVQVHEAPVVGEAREAGRRIARALLDERATAPACVIWSGETTVTVRGPGRGGRNQELALAAIDALAGSARPWLLASLGTDGVDGTSTAAGAVVDPTSLARARARGLDAEAALEANDAGGFFAALGDAIHTGPTGTNVGDLQVALVR